jgi:hypothetical protein
MKKTKLALRTETLLPLDHENLRATRGGFLMRDTVIIRTSGRVEGEPIEPARP